MHAVYEQGPEDGGVWAYSEDVEDDLLGSKASRRRVHGRWVAGRCRLTSLLEHPAVLLELRDGDLLRPGAGRRAPAGVWCLFCYPRHDDGRQQCMLDVHLAPRKPS